MNTLMLLALFAGTACSTTGAAPIAWEQSDLGQTAIVPMQNAPYPHASRSEGFKRGDKTFPRDPHYVDNSVALFIPKGYRPEKRTDLLVYFHGHSNHIRKALTDYKLREQVAAGGKNVIFVFPEGPKDAPDSGGGKLEEKDGLKRFVAEVLDTLAADGKIKGREPGRVVLAGHSGAYQVISFCLEQGGLEGRVSEAWLLDSSYGRLDAFVDWAARNREGRFFTIFTDHLGGENVYMMTHMRKRGLPYELFDEDDVTDLLMKRTHVLFVHTTKLTHDQTVRWLERCLKTSGLADR